MYIDRENIYCSKENYKNILEKGEYFYEIQPLLNNVRKKGGNSAVFRLLDPNEDKYYIIKFCKFNLKSSAEWKKQRIQRFEREIRALTLANQNDFENIIQIFFSGTMKIGNREYCYYVMEKAESDLTDYFENNEIPVPQKVLLCYDILKGLKELHSINIYHRDIKPDNIFFINNKWKIADLGLIDFQDDEQDIDIIKEKIGPYGWLSPEAVNKVLCENTKNEVLHNCKIKSYSDIFQLGKVFWFIFQGNIPIGQIKNDDFLLNDDNIFQILFAMLQYLHSRRPKIDEISKGFKSSFKTYGI